MFAKAISAVILGIDGYMVDVEVDVSSGMPALDLVGLPTSAVKESRERVRTAIKNSGYQFPVKRITINLAPADLKKEGPGFDLPIALGVLACAGIITPGALNDTLIIGELSLDGTVRGINGVLPVVHSAAEMGIKSCIVPYANAEEGCLVSGIDVIGVGSLNEAVGHLNGKEKIPPASVDISSFFEEKNNINGLLDFADVKGQAGVKRALEISASGAHNILLIGPPGSGKTMMSMMLPSIMPRLTFEESIEITKIYSVAGLLESKDSLITTRPFRSPHHTASASSLTGGGRIPKPGEISLAHKGILFLDELPEFSKNALEVLRQPIENRQVTISRVSATVTYPSDFMLVASMNPCPCGHMGSEKCKCTQNEVTKYLSKVSGPLLDRLDMHVEAAAVKYTDLSSDKKSESSGEIKQRVLAAQQRQTERYEHDGILFNSQLSSKLLNKYCSLGHEETSLLKQAFERLGLSARAYHRILKVARTIADLEAEDKIKVTHLAEAIGYRSLDRKYWG